MLSAARAVPPLGAHLGGIAGTRPDADTAHRAGAVVADRRTGHTQERGVIAPARLNE